MALSKGGRIRFEVRIAINPMHRIRGFESTNRIGFNAEFKSLNLS